MTGRRDVLDFLSDITLAMEAALEFVEEMDIQMFCMAPRRTPVGSIPLTDEAETRVKELSAAYIKALIMQAK